MKIVGTLKIKLIYKFYTNIFKLFKTFRKLSEETFHLRGTSKKHEGDLENQATERIKLYMDAVCNFCLCAITQFRMKKSKPSKSIELLNQTWKLLKFVTNRTINYVFDNLSLFFHLRHVNDKDLVNVKNSDFVKKFRVLS